MSSSRKKPATEIRHDFEELMRRALRLALEADTPYGAVIVNERGRVVGESANKTANTYDRTAHAELLAIRKAHKKTRSRDLSGCIIITTFEPCPMCAAACCWSNIDGIVYGGSIIDLKQHGQSQIMVRADDLLRNWEKPIWVKGGILKDECLDLLKERHP